MFEGQQGEVFKVHSLLVDTEILSEDKWNYFGVVETGNAEDFEEPV